MLPVYLAGAGFTISKGNQVQKYLKDPSQNRLTPENLMLFDNGQQVLHFDPKQ